MPNAFFVVFTRKNTKTSFFRFLRKIGIPQQYLTAAPISSTGEGYSPINAVCYARSVHNIVTFSA